VISSTGLTIVPLAADFTTGNIQDNQMYNPMTSSMTTTIPKEKICYMIGDSGYDDQKLYDISINRGFELICPVQRYEHTPAYRLNLIQFYESELGQAIYSWRSKSIEPLIDHIKSVFRIDQLSIRGYQKVCWNNSIISTILSNQCCLLQLQDTQITPKSNQTHVR
jgi:hypothetical protein